MGATKVHTRTLTAAQSFAITASMNVMRLSFKVLTGTMSFQGNAPLDGVASSAISLSAGDSNSLEAYGPEAPLDGITLTAGSPGTVAIEIVQ
jgi:hypothetical protein